MKKIALAITVCSAIALSACSKKPPAELPPAPQNTTTPTPPPPRPTGPVPGTQEHFRQVMSGRDTILFDTDMFNIDAEDQAALRQQANYLSQYPNIRATIEGHQIALGNTRLLEDAGADPTPLASQAESLRSDGASVIYLAVDGRLAGILAVTDPVKDSTPDAIDTLHQAGIRIVMATGDGPTTAKAVAQRLHIDEVYGEVRPQDKADLVARLQSEGRRVAMAGDGINDAPALARANVGIAMGTGTDVAMNSAQITLVKGDLQGIARARQLSEATVRNMYQNLLFALVYNALGVPIAAGILYPFFGILLSPLIAAAAMSLSSVSVVSNALRLRGA